MQRRTAVGWARADDCSNRANEGRQWDGITQEQEALAYAGDINALDVWAFVDGTPRRRGRFGACGVLSALFSATRISRGLCDGESPLNAGLHNLPSMCCVLRRLSVHVPATQRDDIVDWTRTLLVGFHDDRRHPRTHVMSHRIDEARVQCGHHGIPAETGGR